MLEGVAWAAVLGTSVREHPGAPDRLGRRPGRLMEASRESPGGTLLGRRSPSQCGATTTRDMQLLSRFMAERKLDYGIYVVKQNIILNLLSKISNSSLLWD